MLIASGGGSTRETTCPRGNVAAAARTDFPAYIEQEVPFGVTTVTTTSNGDYAQKRGSLTASYYSSASEPTP